MKNIALLIGLTLVTWGLHAFAVTLYSGSLASTKQLAFRAAHALEIGTLVAIMTIVYLALASRPLGAAAAVAVVLGTLLVVDLVLFGAVSSLREKFDLWHFAAAYMSVSAAIVLVYAVRS